MTSSAPAAIALWSFDESTGLWKQEGIGTRNGNNYVGEVSHFSVWNYDVPASFVLLNATLVSNTGSTSSQPLQNMKVKISEVATGNYRFAYTDTAGYLIAAVPQNAQLLFEVYGNLNCPTAVYTQTATTGTTNISLGTININNGNNIAIISGNVISCSNAPVSNGYILVKSGNYYSAFRLTSTGSYSAYLVLCSSTGNAVTLIGEDMATLLQSNPANYNITAGNNVISTLQTCTNTTSTSEFVHFFANGVPRNFDVPPFYIRMSQFAPNIYISYYYDPALTVPAGQFSFTQAGLSLGSTQTLVSLSSPVSSGNLAINNPPVNVSITECGPPITGYVAGNFSGNFTGPAPSNTQYNIVCSFRVKRN